LFELLLLCIRMEGQPWPEPPVLLEGSVLEKAGMILAQIGAHPEWPWNEPECLSPGPR